MTLRSIAFTALLVLALALGVAAGVGIGYSVFSPQTALAESRLDEQQARRAEIEGHVATRDLRIEELLDDVAGVREKLSLLTVERENVVAELEEQRLATDEALSAGSEVRDSLARSDDALGLARDEVAALEGEKKKLAALRESINLMDADRLLLVELRKDMPGDEEEARSYWEGVRDLAVKSDPALGAKVNRVLRLVPAYFEWVESPFENTCGSVQAFFSSGASELGIVSADLEKDVLLVLINRIDTALERALE